jgi:hypothetical protein
MILALEKLLVQTTYLYRQFSVSLQVLLALPVSYLLWKLPSLCGFQLTTHRHSMTVVPFSHTSAAQFLSPTSRLLC